MIQNEGTDGTNKVTVVVDGGELTLLVAGVVTAEAGIRLLGFDLEALPEADLGEAVQAVSKFAQMMRVAAATPQGLRLAAEGMIDLFSSVRAAVQAEVEQMRGPETLGQVDETAKLRIGAALEVPLTPPG